MSWLLLALLSALCLASADAATKRYIADYNAKEIVLVRFVMAGILLLPVLCGQPWPTLGWDFWRWVVAALPVELLAMWLYMQAIRESELSLTLPLLAFTPVFNTLTAYIFLDETIELNGFIGILLVVAGSWMLNSHHRGDGKGLNLLAPFRAMLSEKGSRLMLLVAALYSLTSVFGKGVLQVVPASFYASFYFVLLAIVSVLLFIINGGKPFQVINRQPFVHLLIGTCMAGMVIAHFYAIEYVQVAYMIAVKRISLLFGMVYGAILFGEKNLLRKFLAGCVMVFGVFLIAGY